MQLFMSYAHVDEILVKERILDVLATSEYRVWFDSHLVGGEDWQKQLREKIGSSTAIVYALTPDSAKSENCRWELAIAKEYNKPILPVMLGDTALPGEISGIQYVDFREWPRPQEVAKLISSLNHMTRSASQHSSVGTSQDLLPNISRGKLDLSIALRSCRFQVYIAFMFCLVLIVGILALLTSSNNIANITSTPGRSSLIFVGVTPGAVADCYGRVQLTFNLVARDVPSNDAPVVLTWVPVESTPFAYTLRIDGATENEWYRIDGDRGWIQASRGNISFDCDPNQLGYYVWAVRTVSPDVTAAPSVPTPTATRSDF